MWLFPSAEAVALMTGHLLVIRGDRAHFAAILSTLRFTDTATPTPGNGALESPACMPDRNQQPQEIMNTARSFAAACCTKEFAGCRSRI